MPHVVDHTLVRGLDYYTGTVWEFVTQRLGAQSAVLAGGRYDGLARSLGSSSDVSAVGWAAGVDRIALLVDECGAASQAPPRVDVSVVHVRGSSSSSAKSAEDEGRAADVDAAARRACLVLAQRLREAGFTTDYTHEGDTRKQASDITSPMAH